MIGFIYYPNPTLSIKKTTLIEAKDNPNYTFPLLAQSDAVSTDEDVHRFCLVIILYVHNQK